MTADTSAYGRFVNAKVRRLDGEEANKDMQTAVLSCLMDYAEGRIAQFPHEVAADLAFAMRDILAGIVPDLLRPKKLRRGESPNPPTVHHCIESAVKYVRCCRAGLIKDMSPCKTVAVAFSISETTVRGWCAPSGPERYRTVGAPKVTLREFKESQDGWRVEGLMRFSGRYFQTGEGVASANAHRLREMKRRPRAK